VWGSLNVVQSLPQLGINATADTTNRLAVSAAATLLNHAGAGHQLKINKAAAAQTASLLFQDGFSGRAEMGLAGTDDFSIKVSANGAAWNNALSINRTTGAVTFPNSTIGGGASVRQAEIDFGPMAVRQKRFTITDASIGPASKMVVGQSASAATGRHADENEMDQLHLSAAAGTGSFALHAVCLTGRVSGKFVVSYLA
jgi:hypothetical protein